MAERKGRTVRTRTRVRFGETDAARIVFYPTFFNWFDMGSHSLFRRGDASLRTQNGGPHDMMPIVECGAKFSTPLLFDDAIEIVTTAAQITASTLRVEHRVLRGDTEVATGFEVRIHVARSADGALKSAPIPEDLRAHLLGSDAEMAFIDHDEAQIVQT